MPQSYRIVATRYAEKDTDADSVFEVIPRSSSEKQFLYAILCRAYADTFGMVTSPYEQRTAITWFRRRSTGDDILSWPWVADALNLSSTIRRKIESSIASKKYCLVLSDDFDHS